MTTQYPFIIVYFKYLYLSCIHFVVNRMAFIHKIPTDLFTQC